jgi:hypothetical protein
VLKDFPVSLYQQWKAAVGKAGKALMYVLDRCHNKIIIKTIKIEIKKI